MTSDQGFVYSIALKLHPTAEGTIPATMGDRVHAAFLATVRRADRALAEVLHHPQLPLKPFTVSPLLGVPRALEGLIAISPAQTYYLRFTVLYPPIFQQFMRRFLQGDTRPSLRLAQAEFLISEVLVTPGSSPWAGYSSFVQLWEKAAPAQEIALEFLSPTAFSLGTKAWGKKFAVLPEPTLVFRSVLRTWNAFAPPAVGMAEAPLLDYVAENVVLKRYEAKTQMLKYPRHLQIGFVGQCTYGLMGKENEEERRQLNALADFAFYSGVGYHTTMGMGQVRRVVNWSGGRVVHREVGHEN